MRQFGYHFSLLIDEYESIGGQLVTEAYLDPVGVWTGPGGMTTHGNGVPVRKGDTWSREEALALYAKGQDRFAAEVEAILPDGLELADHQFDALGFFAWNVGTPTLMNSSVMDALRQPVPRYAEAAAAFLLYRRATLWGGRTGPDGSPARDPHGNVMEKGVSWFKAMRGIYRRSAATACCFLGFDWRYATANERIDMAKRTDWVAEENRWVDEVMDQTSWKDILDVARQTPLPPAPEVHTPAPPPIRSIIVMGKKIDLPDNWDFMSPDEQTAWMNTYMSRKLSEQGVAVRPAAKAVTAKGKVVEAPKADLSKDPKAVEDSETVRGEVKVVAGKEAVKVGAAAAGATVAAGTADVVKDYMPVAKEMTGFLKGTDMHTIFVAGGAFAGIMLLIGGWRWWRGAVIKWQGRQRETGPKI
jgi:lysozyme